MKVGRGAWIQYRAYTLTLWSAVVLTFPHFMQDSMFAHRSAHNPWAMLILSAAALVANAWVFVAHVRTIVSKRRNPLTQEVHADEATYASWVRALASDEDKELIAARLGTTPEEAGFTSASKGYRIAYSHRCMYRVRMTAIPLQRKRFASSRRGAARPTAP